MRRRGWLIGFLAVVGDAVAAEPAPPRRRVAPRPRSVAPPPKPTGAAPAIDPAPAPSRAGLDPAPTPARNAQGPARDRVTGTSVEFGVPSPRDPQSGQSFRSTDPGVEGRGESSQGLRVPAPGATVRVPF